MLDRLCVLFTTALIVRFEWDTGVNTMSGGRVILRGPEKNCQKPDDYIDQQCLSYTAYYSPLIGRFERDSGVDTINVVCCAD